MKRIVLFIFNKKLATKGYNLYIHFHMINKRFLKLQDSMGSVYELWDYVFPKVNTSFEMKSP